MINIALLAVTVPLTLACTIEDDGRRLAMTMSVDEARGAVRYALPATAPAKTARAVFTRDRVMFDRFTLDRASLALVRDGEAVTSALGAQPGMVHGRCRMGGKRAPAVTPAQAGPKPAPGRRR